MTERLSFRNILALLPPVLLYAGLHAVLRARPDAAVLADSLPFRMLPYVLLAVSFILGGVSKQSRISHISLLLALVTFLVNYTFFARPDAQKGETVLLLASIYAPLFSLVFYLMSERGLLNIFGLVRAIAVLSVPVFIVLLSGLRPLAQAVAAVPPAAGWLQVPMPGILVFLVCAPFLMMRRPHESPLLGVTIALSLLFAFTALNLRSTLWPGAERQAAFVLFMSGAAATLGWAVMETVWRNAFMDELTELPGRRSLKHHFARLGSSYAIAILDVDRFKRVNDRYGHGTGDQVLRYIAAHLRHAGAGKAYRYGGEEFVIVCEGGNYGQAVAAMDDLRLAISGRPFGVRGKRRPRRKPEPPVARTRGRSAPITVTVSIGIARPSDRDADPQDVLSAADKALYKAKSAGRNRVSASR